MSFDKTRKRVAYVYHDDIKNYNYGQDHPMKPKKVAMTNDLIHKYDLYHDMKVYVIWNAYEESLLCN